MTPKFRFSDMKMDYTYQKYLDLIHLITPILHLQRAEIMLNVTNELQRKMHGKKLFTPGPLGCSKTVKEAMLCDLGSRDEEFIQLVHVVRQKLLNIAEVSPVDFTAILLQGSGTYAVEAALQTSTSREHGQVLVLTNGVYGRRMKMICDAVGIPVHVYEFPEHQAVDTNKVKEELQSGREYTTVAMVHLETSTGVINDVEAIGQLVRTYQPTAAFLVDAMSSFGGVPLQLDCVDYLVSSANKCLQGVPGFAFVLARKKHLYSCRGHACSLSLDLLAQHEELESSGQFRFTPPTHALLAFIQALQEFEKEGGIVGRASRYKENWMVLQQGMEQMGFTRLLHDDACTSYILTCYCCPQHPNFNFSTFYRRLSDKGQLIYHPAKLTNANTFRIGNIGELYADDMRHLVECIATVLSDMGIPVPLTF